MKFLKKTKDFKIKKKKKIEKFSEKFCGKFMENLGKFRKNFETCQKKTNENWGKS